MSGDREGANAALTTVNMSVLIPPYSSQAGEAVAWVAVVNGEVDTWRLLRAPGHPPESITVLPHGR